MTPSIRRARHATRILRQAPGFTLSTVLALAIGIGLGIPFLGAVRSALQGAPRPIDSLLPGIPETVAWIPGRTDALRTIPQLQNEGLRTLLWLLLALTLLVLAIALVNVVTSILARAAVRRPEIALRAVLGAVQRRLIGDLAAEGAILLSIGVGAGVALGVGVAYALQTSWPGEIPPWGRFAIDGRVALGLLGGFLLIPLLAWISPVEVAWRRNLQGFLTTGGRATAGRGEAITRQALAIAQIAASLVLLTCAGLLLRGFSSSQVESRELGFDPHDTLTVQILLPARTGDASPAAAMAMERARGRLAALPGVLDTSVATPGSWLGLGATDRVRAVCPECWIGTMIKVISDGDAQIDAVSPGSFAAMGAHVTSGREFTPEDRTGAPRVAMVNQTFAYKLIPNGEPLGKRVQIGGRDGAWYTVVGVVSGFSARGLGSGGTQLPAIYLSTLQHGPAVIDLAVRTRGDPMGMMPAVDRAIHSVAPGARLSAGMTMEHYLARFRAPIHWFALLFAVEAGAALLLAGAGLHGIISYQVTRRTREIGVRMALGATSRDISRMVLGQSLRTVRAGTLLGLAGALSLGRLLQILLQGISWFDPALFAGIALLLGSIALLAGYRPARHAASVDPQISLRAE